MFGRNPVKKLFDFIDASPTAFHAVENAKLMLEKHGFETLQEKDSWNIQPGGKYYLIKNDSAIFAFIAGTEPVEKAGFRIIGAHTDSPGLRIKPSPDMKTEGYHQLNTEVYGGPILNTWLDRPLSIAGRLILKSKNPWNAESKLIDFNDPIAMIPNVAIHLNRDVNKGLELNRQSDLEPIIGMASEGSEKKYALSNLVSEHTGIAPSDIADMDLFLYPVEKSAYGSLDHTWFSAPRLDNLASVYAGLSALLESVPSKHTSLVAFFDNEEVGSATLQGADSSLLATLLERICNALGKSREDYFRALAVSFLVSADAAHALHPNKTDRSDPTNRPVLNGGPVIKYSANQRYTSDAFSASYFEAICRKAGVPVQRYANRSDQPGGSTIGPISLTQINIRSVDCGLPILAMHSIRETGGSHDVVYLEKAFLEYFRA